MPVLRPPPSLLDLSIRAVGRNVDNMVASAAYMTESADDALQGAEEQIHDMMTQNVKLGTNLASDLHPNLKDDTLSLNSIQKILKSHRDFPNVLSKYLETVPGVFTNELYNQALPKIANIIIYDDDEIENFMVEKWCFAPRVKVAIHFLLKSMLNQRIHTMNMNVITNRFFKSLSEYLLKKDCYKDIKVIKDMEEKANDIFAVTFESYRNNLFSLTHLSLQNLAHGELLWLICCHCPNLWHLDISGGFFDLQRYCVIKKSGGEYVTAYDKSGRRNYREAEFLNSLCGLYGNNHIAHKKFNGIAHGCHKLKTLLLPETIWEKNEEDMLIEEINKTFELCPFLEEVTGVCLLYILCKMNERDVPPLMLKLKKFDGTTGGHSLVGIDPKRLQKVHLPFVTEVVFSLNCFMPPATLKIFPNMKHLTVSPYDYRSYTCDTILPYLKNLHTLDMELTHEMSLSNMCDIAENCQLLQSLTLTCPALRVKALTFSDAQISKEQLERISSPPLIRMDVKNKKDYEPKKPVKVLQPNHEYVKTLLKINTAWYEKEANQIPPFSRLRTLQFFGVRNVDAAALYKCVRGSPRLETFTFVAHEKDSNCSIEIDDCFIGRIAPMMKRLKEITLSAEDSRKQNFQIGKLTTMAIEHLIKFCNNIQSIGTMTNWHITSDEVKAFNYYFKKSNYIVRLH